MGVPELDVPFTPISTLIRFRDAIRRSVPPKVTTSWAQAQLGAATVKTAQNRLGELKRLGLLNDEGQVTEAAMKLRADESFAEGCRLILRGSFPAELVEAFDGHPGDEKQVENVIVGAGKGESLARQAAALFVFLQRGQPLEAKPVRLPSASRSVKHRAEGSPAATKQESSPPASQSLFDVATHQASVPNVVPMTETLRYWLGDGRTAELRIPKDIAKGEMRRLMRHIQLDLDDMEAQAGE